MTLKEKVAEVEPEKINTSSIGGVYGCPNNYPYLNAYKPEYCSGVDPECSECWNREYIPHEVSESICIHCKFHRNDKDEEPCKYCMNESCIDNKFESANVHGESDSVNHPEHYQGKYECIDEMVALFGVEAVKHFCMCNVYKYRFRATRKNGDEDIKKAENYMEFLIRLERDGDLHGRKGDK